MKEGRAEDGEIRQEYDFSKARRNPYAEPANRNTNVVVIEPELYKVFPGSEAVNDALRLIVKASAKALKTKSVKRAAELVKAD